MASLDNVIINLSSVERAYVVLRFEPDENTQPLYLATNADGRLGFQTEKSFAMQWQLTVGEPGEGTLRTAVAQVVSEGIEIGADRWIVFNSPNSRRISGDFDLVQDEPRLFFRSFQDGRGNYTVFWRGQFSQFQTAFTKLQFESVELSTLEDGNITGVPDAEFTAANFDPTSGCGSLLLAALDNETEPLPQFYDALECTQAGIKRSLEAGNYPDLSIITYENSTRSLSDTISSFIVPENWIVELYDDRNYEGEQRIFTAGAYNSLDSKNNVFSSAIVRRVLPYELFQISMCAGRANSSTQSTRFKGPTIACDQVIENFCRQNNYPGKVCNCEEDILSLEDTQQQIFGNVEVSLPVVCFGPQCGTISQRGYVRSNAITECNQTICAQVINSFGSDFVVKGNEQNLTCNGDPLQLPDEVPVIPPPPLPETPTFVEKRGLSTGAAIGIAVGATVLVIIIIAVVAVVVNNNVKKKRNEMRKMQEEMKMKDN